MTRLPVSSKNAFFGKSLAIHAGKAASNVAVDFVNTAFGTTFSKGDICGNPKKPNITLTSTGTTNGSGETVVFRSVVGDIKGVITLAKR